MTDGQDTVRRLVSVPILKALRVEVVDGPDRGKTAVAKSDTITVGTSLDNDVVLADNTVSRYHLELRHLGKDIQVEDLGSTNGTMLGKAILERAKLLPGAVLKVGNTSLRVDDGEPLRLETHDRDSFFGIRGKSQSMRRLMVQIKRAAQSDASILELGETGAGKEVIAHAVHRASGRSDQPFEIVDCGALAPALIASELFGHEQGAFTGAYRRHIGAFERAMGGTLFLDEIGELPNSLQTTLLGVLERRSFRRLGGDTPISVDTRLICATHRDLRAEVNAGTFREDLYYRIAVIRLPIPSLRNRQEDIPTLVEHFLREAGFEGRVEEVIPPEVMDHMMEYRWPGNVRELRNFVDSALAMGETPRLEEHANTDLDPTSFPSVPFDQLMLLEYKDARNLVLSEFELGYLSALIKRANNNVSEASRLAKINRTYLIEMLKRHSLR